MPRKQTNKQTAGNEGFLSYMEKDYYGFAQHITCTYSFVYKIKIRFMNKMRAQYINKIFLSIQFRHTFLVYVTKIKVKNTLHNNKLY